VGGQESRHLVSCCAGIGGDGRRPGPCLPCRNPPNIISSQTSARCWPSRTFSTFSSNVAFLLVGRCRHRSASPKPFAACIATAAGPFRSLDVLVLFAAVALTCVGSAYYHLAPTTSRLTWDRLPMSRAFMALLAADDFGENSSRAGMTLLGPLVLVASPACCTGIGRGGRNGKLRPYVPSVLRHRPLSC